MAQSTNSSDQQPDNTAQQGQQQSPWKKYKKYLAFGVLAILAVVIIFEFLPFGSPSINITQNSSLNSTPIYMSYGQAASLLGPLLNYSTYDMYSKSAPINITSFVEELPELYGNVSSGWVTLAEGANTTYNATADYVVLTTNNTETMAKLLGSNITAGTDLAAVVVSPGVVGALNYTYGQYANSTLSLQTLYGWKGDNVVLMVVGGNPGFLANESQMVAIAENATPLR